MNLELPLRLPLKLPLEVLQRELQVVIYNGLSIMSYLKMVIYGQEGGDLQTT